jgi:hypothetical protein
VSAVVGPVLNAIAGCVTRATVPGCLAAGASIILIGTSFADADADLAAEDTAAGADDAATPLYRVSPAARGSSELDNGLDPANFPRTEDLDGAARFGNEARVQDFAANNEGYGVGFRVDVLSSWLSANGIEPITGMTEDQLEYAIPRELFDEFNQFPRYPWSPGK